MGTQNNSQQILERRPMYRRSKTRPHESSRGSSRFFFRAPNRFPARTHPTILPFNRGPSLLTGRPRHELKGFHSIASVIWEALPTDAPIMSWQKSFSLPWLIGSTYLFLRIICDIHGKYINRAICRSEDKHAFPFLQNNIGMESTIRLIQSHQSSMRRTQADSTV